MLPQWPRGVPTQGSHSRIAMAFQAVNLLWKITIAATFISLCFMARMQFSSLRTSAHPKQHLEQQSQRHRQAVHAFAAITGDHYLDHLARLAEQAAASGMPMRAVRTLYSDALSQVSRQGVLDVDAMRRAIRRHSAMSAFVMQAMVTLAQQGEGRVVPCDHDPTLPGPPKGRYLIVSNLHNSEHIMRNYVLQLLRLVLLLPPGDAYVMIYESDSSDSTARWLALLQLLLEPIGVGANITANGALVRRKGQERIEYLAEVRNALLAPFFNATCVGQESHPASQAGCFQPDHILFINDIYWCVEDAVRLMQHENTDMACAIDFGKFVRRKGEQVPTRRRTLLDAHNLAGQQQSMAEQQSDIPKERLQQQPPLARQQQLQHKQARQRLQQHEQAGRQAVAASRARHATFRPGVQSIANIRARLGRTLLTADPLEQKWTYPQILLSTEPNYGTHGVFFYDIWVARERTGERFLWASPWVTNDRAVNKVQKGLPVPVYCCWNGMVMLNPEPFRRGLRFRTHLHGECKASECSLLCDDYHRLGFSRVIMDPSVRVGYGYTHKWVMTDPHWSYTNLTGLNVTDWAAVAATPAIDWSDPSTRPSYGNITCCDKEPGSEGVVWEKCHKVNVLQPNHTAKFFEQCLPSMTTGKPASYAVSMALTQTANTSSWHISTEAPCPTA